MENYYEIDFIVNNQNLLPLYQNDQHVQLYANMYQSLLAYHN